MSADRKENRGRKATAQELERLLAMEDMEVEIRPDGSIFAREKISPETQPITFREDIGYEY